MDTTILTNVLFFVLSVFILLIIIGFSLLLFYVISIFKTIKREAEKIETDIDAIRDKIKDGGTLAASFLIYLVSFFKKHNKKSK